MCADLHVCDLVLLPVEALHLVLLQLLAGLHILVIVSLQASRATGIVADTVSQIRYDSMTQHLAKTRSTHARTRASFPKQPPLPGCRQFVF